MIINGEEMEFKEGLTVAKLLDNLGLNHKNVVVEVDMNIIYREEFETKELNSTSKVEIIRFVGGG